MGKQLGSLPPWRDEMVCIASAANEALPARLTPAQFQASRYVAFRRGPRIPSDVHTQIQPTSPLEVSPVCTVPSFLALGTIVARSNTIALVPRKEERRLLYVAITRAKDNLSLVMPQRFFTHGQNAHGDRHVYASRTRFIPKALLQHFECTTWPLPAAPTGQQLAVRQVRIDVGARMRDQWR